MLSEDLDQFFRDFGVQADRQPKDGAERPGALVIFDNPDDLVLGGAVLVQNTSSITFPTGTLAGLEEEEILTINGVPWRVQEPPKAIEDGKLTTALIIEA